MRVLASDFDKTLYIQDFDFLEKNILAIKKFINEGNIFIIITGRSYFDIKILLNKFSIPYSYLICEDGAKMYDSNDYCISTVMIDSTVVSKVISIVDNNLYNYLLDDGYNYTNNINDCIKIAIPYDNYSDACLLLDEIKKNVSVEGYISDKHININSCGVNKCNALKKLMSIEKFNYNDIYVIGDDVNDFEMIKHFNGAILSQHNSILDDLNKENYDYLYMYIEELCKK